MLDNELTPDEQWLVADDALLDCIRLTRKYLATNPSEELARILDDLEDVRSEVMKATYMTLKLMTPVYRLAGVRCEESPYRADRLGLGDSRQTLEIIEILEEVANGTLTLTPSP